MLCLKLVIQKIEKFFSNLENILNESHLCMRNEPIIEIH